MVLEMERRNLAGVRLSASQLKAISEKMTEALQEPVYLYPWESLERDLETRGLSRFPIVAYGSLINIKSVAVTLQDKSLGQRRPVIAFGARRLFNYKMPKDNRRYGPTTGRYRAALNLRTTDNIDDVVNGILFEITLGEIPAMRAREIGYDLVPVATIGWNETEDPVFLAYILRCPDEPLGGKRLTSDNIVPHRQYYLICRGGAREISENFLRFWLATTYLADGVTPVSQWEAAELPEMIGGDGEFEVTY